MNKKMRDLLNQIEARTKAARELQGDTTKSAEFSAAMDEIADLQAQYNTEKALYDAEQIGGGEQHGEPQAATGRDADVKTFAGYIRSVVDKTSTPQNVTYGGNGAIISETIAREIITMVKEMCPIYARATVYHVKGKLMLPVYGDATDTDSNAHNINVAFANEFTELTADVGKFTSVELEGFLCGALSLIGKSVINNSDNDVVAFIENEMAKRIAIFLSNKLLNGESNKNDGALSSTNTLTTAAATAITADELIAIQAKVPTMYQNESCWYMHPDTLTYLRKLKYTGTGEYILNPDMTGEFPYRLLGKPVFVDSNMPTIAASAKAIAYGDMSGLGVNMREEIEVQVLTEKYATMHAVGVVAWFDFDSAVADNSKIAVLVQKAS